MKIIRFTPNPTRSSSGRFDVMLTEQTKLNPDKEQEIIEMINREFPEKFVCIEKITQRPTDTDGCIIWVPVEEKKKGAVQEMLEKYSS